MKFSSRSGHARNHLKLYDELDALGFFRYTRPDDLKGERAALLEQGWAGVFASSARLHMADAEELAEGGVSQFIGEIAPFLTGQKVVIPPLEDEYGDEYHLIADRERVTIWTRDELNREEEGEPGLLWGLSAARTVLLINQWLECAGSSERAYGVNGGNDFDVIFLTPELHARISRDPQASLPCVPYTPTLKYPWFGQVAQQPKQ